jgi:hypothetical protein
MLTMGKESSHGAHTGARTGAHTGDLRAGAILLPGRFPPV